MTAISMRFPATLEAPALLRTLALCVLLVAAVVATVVLVHAVTPFVLLALPVLGKLLVGGVLVAAYAVVFRPKGA